MRDAVETMPTIDVMERRLLAWAAWLTGGRSSAGYPTKNVLHQSWLPPAAGQLPAMVSVQAQPTAQERQVHAALGQLSVRLQNTVVVVYVMRAAPDEQARLLECQASTVRARVGEAKAALSLALLGNR